MTIPDTTTKPTAGAGSSIAYEPVYQVILYNDDHNTMEHVIKVLMQVFGHEETLAVKIMVEAHHRGKAVAEVEPESKARLHCDQLQSYSLIATIEQI